MDPHLNIIWTVLTFFLEYIYTVCVCINKMCLISPNKTQFVSCQKTDILRLFLRIYNKTDQKAA